MSQERAQEYDASDMSADYPPDEMGEQEYDQEDEDNARRDSWLSRARAIYESSTDYLDSSVRAQWEDSLRHFNNEHASGSKYHTDAYKQRSRVFRPKTRTIVRGHEAAAAAALFSNMDLLDISPVNQQRAVDAVSAAINKALVQARLENTIPWFLTAIGAYQDTKLYGICISKTYWKYREKVTGYSLALDDYGQPLIDEESGMPLGEAQMEVAEDKPWVDLIAPENFRYSPNADWRDPAGTSPYLIELIPMTAGEVRARINTPDPKTGQPEWIHHSLSAITAKGQSAGFGQESIRLAREGSNRQDPIDIDALPEHEIVWVHFNVYNNGDSDMAFYTLGTQALLSEPKPLTEYFALGRETYRVGFSMLEAHKTNPTGDAALVKPIQQEINDVANQRMDNVRLILNKRYFIRRQANVDFDALMRNVPGGGVMVDNPQQDVFIPQTPDVTGSSYQEHDRLSVEMDELAGSFSQASVASNRSLNQTVGGMNLMSSGAGIVQDYAIKLFVETWVEPVLRTLVKLEQMYETDENVIQVACGEASKKLRMEIWQEMITDDVLNQDMKVRVNVGMGYTNPAQRVERTMMTLNVVGQVPDLAARVKWDEFGKEAFASAGWGDGERFVYSDEEMQQMQEQQGQQQDPMSAIKQAELEMKDRQFQAQLELQRELGFAKLALEENITLAKLQQQLGIETGKVQTNRQIAALRETNKTRELNLKAETGSGI